MKKIVTNTETHHGQCLVGFGGRVWRVVPMQGKHRGGQIFSAELVVAGEGGHIESRVRSRVRSREGGGNRGSRGGHVFEQSKGTVGRRRRCPIGRRTTGTVLFDKPVLPLVPAVVVGHLPLPLHLQQRGLYTVHQFFLDVGGDVLHFRAGAWAARVAGWGWG
jgi:hypothetical protein